MHRPVLLEECATLVCGIGPDRSGTLREGVYVDATFGRGGHARRLLELLGPAGTLVAVDRDPAAVAAAEALAREDPRVLVRHANFAELGRELDGLGIGAVQGVIMDLGVSSPQLDDPQRGFSFRFDAPLDMRMDNSGGTTAAEWLNAAAAQDIARVLRDLGEERHARRIASAIVAARPLSTTGQLAELVQRAQPRSTPGKHDATRVFQAVRMHVNGELEALQQGLEAAFERLDPGGRLAVISFHSLEDRVVKRFFGSLAAPRALPRRLPVQGDAEAAPALLVGSSRVAGETERRDNPRARSARLRVLEKVA